MSNATPKRRRKRKDTRIQVCSYRTASPLHARAFKAAARDLGLTVEEFIEIAANYYLVHKNKRIMPPRLENTN